MSHTIAKSQTTVNFHFGFFFALIASVCLNAFCIEIPVSVDERLTVELVAQEPEIVTPTGLAVDERGRIWVIENNTHFTPKNYKGFASDRIQIFEDFAPGGRAQKVTTFADGFRNSMSLALGKNGDVYFAMRNEILLLRDTNNSGRANERKTLITLKTTGDYPHNGLSGLALGPGPGPDRWLYFGLGENLGAPYTLSGSDGTTLTGGGEGGNVFRCKLDGSKLQLFATGFWNPFGLGFDAFERLFAVDNDPDSRSPCRILHVVEGGDYGFRFRYGRKGIHPFVAWNGEIPGTLPMISGTGEAPCAVVAFERPGMPRDFRGDLLVTSWGDHVIQRFKLIPDGASFHALPEALIKGGLEFRPVAMVAAPDGSLLVDDWVSSSYPVHGKGRIWRIRMKDAADDNLRVSNLTAYDAAKLRELLKHPNIEIRNAAAETLAAKGAADLLADALANEPESRTRAVALRASVQLQPTEKRLPLFELGLRDTAPEIRVMAARILAENTPNAEQKLLMLVRQDQSADVRMEALLHLKEKQSGETILASLASIDAFIFDAAVDALGRIGAAELLLANVQAENVRTRLGVLLALRKCYDRADFKDGEASAKAVLPRFLKDNDAAVRRAAIQWVGEQRITGLAEPLDEVVRLPMTRDLFEAYLAAKSLLSGDKPDKGQYIESQMAQIFPSDKNPAHMRALALKNLRVDHLALTIAKLKELLASDNAELRTEAIRALSLHAHPDAQPELRKLAADPALSIDLRAGALAGLARSAATDPETKQFLLSQLNDAVPWELQREALRALRGAGADTQDAVRAFAAKIQSMKAEVRSEMAEQAVVTLRGSATPPESLNALNALAGNRPGDEAGWLTYLAKPGPIDSAAAGERIFYHVRGAQCFMCHRINGRGGEVGPDLTTIGNTVVRDKIFQSILDPSRDVAPQFVPWLFTLKDGRKLTGVIIEENDGVVILGESTAHVTKFKENDIDRRAPQKGSVMPDGLPALLTQQELRDLLAFLAGVGNLEHK